MKYSFDYDSHSTKALLKQMMELQLLFSDQHPNIIVSDYFERLSIPCNPNASNYIIAEKKINNGHFDGISRKFPDS